MSKVDFINDFNKICEELNININPRIEYGLKISKESVNSDRVSIGLKTQDVTQDNLIHIVDKLFNNTENTTDFIKKIYKEHGDKIQQIFLGYSNEATEVYFECHLPGESSYCFSFNSTDNEQSEYYPLADHTSVINGFVDLIKEKTLLIIPEPNEIFKGGFVKNGDIYYILVMEPLVRLESIFKLLCYNTNPNEKEIVDEWFKEHKDKTLSNMAYTIKNNQLILNIYVDESRTT